MDIRCPECGPAHKSWIWGRSFPAKIAQSDGRQQQVTWNSPPDPTYPVDPPETQSSWASQTLRSICAGGQDDGS